MNMRVYRSPIFLILLSLLSVIDCRAPRFVRVNSDGNATVQCSYWRELGEAGVSFNVTRFNTATNESDLAEYDVVFKPSWGNMLVSKDEIVQTINAQGGDGEAEFSSWQQNSWGDWRQDDTRLAVVTLKQPTVGAEYTCNFFYDASTTYGQDETSSSEFTIISSTSDLVTSQLIESYYNKKDLANWYIQTEENDVVFETVVNDDWASYDAVNYTFHGVNSMVEIVFRMKTLNSTVTYSYEGEPAMQVRAKTSDQTSGWIDLFGTMEGDGYGESDFLISIFFMIGVLVAIPALFIASMVAALIRGKVCRNSSGSGCCQ